MMRILTTAFFCVLAIGIGHSDADAQDGSLRAAHCSNVTRPALLIHNHPRPPYPILLASLTPQAPNARWRLVPAGDKFGILSHFEQHGLVAITVTANGNAGETVVASPWIGSAQQLWNAVNLGRLWTFTWPATGMALKTSADRCDRSVPMVLGPNSGGNSWIWNDP